MEFAAPGQVYVAPAENHMRLHWVQKRIQIELFQGTRINYVIPSADPLFESAAQIFGTRLLGFVLTGMGEDGKRGACAIKDKGGCVMIQDQASSVVWGMPGAVHESGAFDKIGSLEECGHIISILCSQ